MWKHDPQHTGYTTSDIPRDNNLVWKFWLGNSITSSPAVVNGKVYFGSFTKWMESSAKSFFCLSADSGQLMWAENLGIIHMSSPAVEDGKVFISSPVTEGNRTYSLSAENGGIVWEKEIAADRSPVVVGGKVYIGSSDGEVYALDAENGNVLWSRNIGGYLSSPAVFGSRIYIGSSDGEVYALDAENGNVLWSRETGYGTHTPSVGKDKIFVLDGGLGTKGKVYGLDANDGVPIWSKEGSSIYVGAEAGSSPAITDNAVVVGLDYYLIALKPENGDVIWSYKVDGLVESSPAVASGRVYIGSLHDVSGGSLYAFGTPPPTIEQLGKELSGVVELGGVAEGDAVQAVEINWGKGWVEAGVALTQEDFRTTRYLNRWTYNWDTSHVPDNTYELRVRIRYRNGTHSDETTITLRVNNAAKMLDRIVFLSTITLGAAAVVGLVLYKRRWLIAWMRETGSAWVSILAEGGLSLALLIYGLTSQLIPQPITIIALLCSLVAVWAHNVWQISGLSERKGKLHLSILTKICLASLILASGAVLWSIGIWGLFRVELGGLLLTLGWLALLAISFLVLPAAVRWAKRHR
ncbi:MAG: PQQ-binding-like beta-propeller repeat protein [Hadesarchaea archaeon]|nr:PQQ-binding-like beta-propeller repeat protein [Hadesarchaea archaeon]